jgi:hypothetical protein
MSTPGQLPPTSTPKTAHVAAILKIVVAVLEKVGVPDGHPKFKEAMSFAEFGAEIAAAILLEL